MNKKKDFLYCWLPIVVLCLTAYWIQVNIYLHHDVAIIAHTAELMLQGQTYTHGIIEPNPPMIFYLNFLPIIVSKITEIPMIYVFRVYVILLIVISLACSNLFFKILFQQNSRLKYLMSFVLACILLFLPIDAFGQREHFFLILTIPYILLVASRLEHKKIQTSMAVLVGIMAGIGFSIKPYFLITLFCIELLVSYRKKSVFSWLRIESIIAILIIFLYGLSVLIYYPEFLSIVVPLWIPFYYARIEPWINILDCFYFVFCCAAIALSCFNYDKEPYSMIKMVFVVTILGDLIVFLIPRTTWYYHILPAFSIACLYFTLILGELSQEKSINPSRGADKSAIIQMATLVPFFMLVFACASETIKKIAYFHSDNSMNKIIAFINKRQSDHSYDFFSITHRLNILEYYSTMKYVGTFPFFWEFSKLLPKQDALVYLNTSLPYVLNIISHDLNDKKPQFIIIDKIAAEWYLNQRIDYPKEYSKNKSFREAWSHYNYLETIEFFDIYQREKQ